MTKYKKYVQKMFDENTEIFKNFKLLHANYALDEALWQEKFNKEGEKILAIIHQWENKLCRQSEKAGYANFTTNLAEKFQAELKREFPLIDHVGLVVTRTPSDKNKFSLPKIKLF